MKRRLLIAACEPRLVGQLSNKLPAQRYELLWSNNSHEVLERFDLRQVHLVLVDLDVPMPEGWSELAGLIRRNPVLRIIGLTERSDLLEFAAGARLSALAERPIDFKALLQTIEDLVTQPPGVIGLRYVPPAVAPSHKVPYWAANRSSFPAAYSGWGINE